METYFAPGTPVALEARFRSTVWKLSHINVEEFRHEYFDCVFAVAAHGSKEMVDLAAKKPKFSRLGIHTGLKRNESTLTCQGEVKHTRRWGDRR